MTEMEVECRLLPLQLPTILPWRVDEDEDLGEALARGVVAFGEAAEAFGEALALDGRGDDFADTLVVRLVGVVTVGVRARSRRSRAAVVFGGSVTSLACRMMKSGLGR